MRCSCVFIKKQNCESVLNAVMNDVYKLKHIAKFLYVSYSKYGILYTYASKYTD